MKALALVLAVSLSFAAPTARAEEALVHDVFFELKDDTPAGRASLVAACRKYLTGHPGVLWFAAGTIAEDLARPVNDRDWDVSLHIYFKDKASHDAYQVAPRHKEFIAEQQAHWKRVRVFDSIAEVGR